MLTVVAVDILLIGGCWFLRVFPLESADGIRRVFEVVDWVPGTIWVVEACQIDSVLDLVSVVSGVEEFLHFPLLQFLDDNGRWWQLVMSRDRLCTGFWVRRG